MSKVNKSTYLFITLGVALGVGLVLVASVLFTSPVNLNGSVIDPPAPAPEIILQDQYGHPFSLDHLRGSLVLVFFGYTHCPDVCPATLVDYAGIFERLGDLAAAAQFVFITVDPQRDTPDTIANYLGAYNPGFIGLTGSPEELQKVYDSYGVDVEIAPGGGSPGYEVNHNTRIYVIDPEGLLVETFPFGLPREAMLDDILHWIE